MQPNSESSIIIEHLLKGMHDFAGHALTQLLQRKPPQHVISGAMRIR